MYSLNMCYKFVFAMFEVNMALTDYIYDHEYTAYEVSGEEGIHGYEL